MAHNNLPEETKMITETQAFYGCEVAFYDSKDRRHYNGRVIGQNKNPQTNDLSIIILMSEETRQFAGYCFPAIVIPASKVKAI